jgi:transposase
MPSCLQFDEFARGCIIGMHLVGAKPTAIATKVRKSDNKKPKVDAVRKTIQRWKKDKKWRGERKAGSGRPPLLSDCQKKRIREIVFKYRGSEVVTSTFIMKRLPSLKKVSQQTVCRALHEAGLAWLRRRRNKLTPRKHVPLRKSFARWLLRQPVGDTAKFAFVDGAAFYLALSESQAENQERGRLGQFVWRDASGKDILYAQ